MSGIYTLSLNLALASDVPKRFSQSFKSLLILVIVFRDVALKVEYSSCNSENFFLLTQEDVRRM